MCKLFFGLDPTSYTFQIRSVRLGGHATSIRLEVMFWNILDKLAAEETATLDRFLTRLHDETLRFQGEADDFTSLLRCACLVYVESKKDIFDDLGPPSDVEWS
ncbi:putative DNA-binding ribbon-helix-helix protein [Nitrobacteraceae bacterium AZCC 2146]